MTYDYQIISTGAVIQVEQRISEPAHTVLEIDGELHSVKRLISGTPHFDLRSGPSGGWASQGYSKSLAQRKCDKTLGRT